MQEDQQFETSTETSSFVSIQVFLQDEPKTILSTSFDSDFSSAARLSIVMLLFSATTLDCESVPFSF
jgi:hypothetical protein